jgi:hypothetical protein
MASHIERRKFLAALVGAAVSWSIAARAQQFFKGVQFGPAWRNAGQRGLADGRKCRFFLRWLS